jgi:hypothetical protein
VTREDQLTEFPRGTFLTGLSDLQRTILAAALAGMEEGRHAVRYPELLSRHYGPKARSAGARAALCRSVSRLERLGLVERRYRIIRGGGGVCLTAAGAEAARRLREVELAP